MIIRAYNGAMQGNEPVRRRPDALGYRQSLGHGLLDRLVEFWPLGEQVGNRAGVHSGLDLTSTAGVSGQDGQDALASQFTAASSQYLTRASQAELQTGNVDFTVLAWIYANTLPAAQMVVAKDNSTAGQREYEIYTTTSVARFDVFKATDVQVTETPGPTITANTWTMLVGWFDSATGTARIEANANGSISASTAGNTLQAASSADFRIGGRQYSGALSPFDGRIQRVGLWKRVLTANERSYLYNNARGRNYPFV